MLEAYNNFMVECTFVGFQVLVNLNFCVTHFLLRITGIVFQYCSKTMLHSLYLTQVCSAYVGKWCPVVYTNLTASILYAWRLQPSTKSTETCKFASFKDKTCRHAILYKLFHIVPMTYTLHAQVKCKETWHFPCLVL